MPVSQRLKISAALSAILISFAASAQQATPAAPAEKSAPAAPATAAPAAPATPAAAAPAPTVATPATAATPATVATPATAATAATPATPAVAPASAAPLDPVAKLKKDLSATDSDKGTTVNLNGDLVFDFNQASIRTEVGPTLTKLADLVRKSKKKIDVSGHTDTQGNAEYNKKLSQLRAEAVKSALVQRGILASRIKTAGYGADQPKVANKNPDGTDNPKGRETNRRVEVLIAKK